ncbi:MAG: translocation/assembly module TamB domain-containing protein [Chitinispirillales bacterium]|jgi:autotransporter translocation and assembly factor TamB|nr:translocation/assembly module TamB domain-containing protein [Chitinispirillales bacterium]
MGLVRHRLKLIALWFAAVCLGVAVLLLALSITFYFVLLYPPLQERAVRFAEEKFSEHMLGEITIERLESNLLSYIDIQGIRATGKSGYGDSAYVGRVTVHYWIPALIGRQVRVTHAQVTDVRGHVVMGPGNDVFLPFLPLRLLDSNFRLLTKTVPQERKMNSDHIPNPADWPVEVVLGNVRVDGISAVYRDFANEMVGEIINASATAQFHRLDSFSVQLRVPGGSYRSPWWDGTIDTIGASGVVTWKNLRVNSLLFSGSGTHVTGSGHLSYFPDGPWDLKADFMTPIKPVPILYEHSPEVGRDGVLQGTASFGGKLFEPIYAARVRGFGVVYDGHRIENFDVDAAYGRDEYGRARVRGTTELGQFDVTAALLMKNLMTEVEFGDYSVSGVLTGLDAEKVSRQLNVDLPIPIDGGNVRFSGVGNSSIDIPTFVSIPTAFDVSAELEGPGFAGKSVEIEAAVKNSDWTFRGNWGINRVDGAGRVNMANSALSGHVNVDMPDAALVFAGERVSGQVKTNADISGRLDNLPNFSVFADITGDRVEWRGMSADSVEAQAEFSGGKLHLHRADGHLLGWVDSVAAYFGQDSVGGYLDAEFSLRGGLDNLALVTRFRARELRYAEYVLDTAAGFASMENDTLRWNNLYLRGMGTSIESEGRLTLGDNMELTVKAELFNEQDETKTAAGMVDARGMIRNGSLDANIRVVSVPLDLFNPWVHEEHRMKGIVSLTGRVSGTVDNPDARVNLRLTEPSYSGYTVYSIFGDAVLRDSLVTAGAMVRLSRYAEAVEFKAALPFLPASDWKLDETGSRTAFIGARSPGFRLENIVKFLDLEPDLIITGTASFDAHAVNTGEGWKMEGAALLPDGYVRVVPEDVTFNDVRANVDLTGTLENPVAEFTVTTGSVRIQPLRLGRGIIKGRTGLDTLEIDSARFVYRGNGFVDLRNGRVIYKDAVDSILYGQNIYTQYTLQNFPVMFFSPLMEGFTLDEGLLNGSGVFYGENGRPLLDGEFLLSGLYVDVEELNPVIGPVSAEISLADSTIVINSLTANWGRLGLVRATGRMFWNNEKVYNMDLRLTGGNLALEVPEMVNVGIVNTNLTVNDLNGNGGFLVSGRATLAPTTYIRDILLMELIDQMQIGEDVRRVPNPFLQSIQLRIDVDLTNNMKIDINLGAITMDGRPTITGTAAEPSFVGEVRITDGFVYYLDRKFLITEGTLFNSDPNEFNPNLRIVAKSEVTTFSPNARSENFVVTLNITETLESPMIRFSAEPALSELDIISVLTFGERMGGMGSDINNRLMNIAAQQAIGFGTRRLERLLHLDRISVSGDLLGGSQGAGATIGVSKGFASRLFITYETNTVKLDERKVTAQFRPLLRLPNFFIEGQATGEGENALDLIYRFSR